MEAAQLPWKWKESAISYLSETFFFTESLRKEQAGHGLFLLCEKNKVFANPHGPAILKIRAQ